MFDSELSAMASESYERAYGAMVVVQQLSELEEAIEYRVGDLDEQMKVKIRCRSERKDDPELPCCGADDCRDAGRMSNSGRGSSCSGIETLFF